MLVECGKEIILFGRPFVLSQKVYFYGFRQMVILGKVVEVGTDGSMKHNDQ
jgi:hypothetical protein